MKLIPIRPGMEWGDGPPLDDEELDARTLGEKHLSRSEALQEFNPYHVQSGEHGGEFTSGVGGVAASIATAERQDREHKATVGRALDALPDGYTITTKRKTWTKTKAGGDIFWTDGKRFLTGAQLFTELGAKQTALHVPDALPDWAPERPEIHHPAAHDMPSTYELDPGTKKPTARPKKFESIYEARSSDDCIWRMINGNPVCIHSHGEHGISGRLPTTAKAAGALIVQNLLAQRERVDREKKLHDDPKEQAKVARRWAKNLKDRMGIRPDFREAILEAIDYNRTSPAYMQAVKQIGGEAVVAALAENDNAPQAEFQGTTFVYQSPHWNDEKATALMRTNRSNVPIPGQITVDNSWAGTLRHEYGHRVAQAWLSMDLDDHYAKKLPAGSSVEGRQSEFDKLLEHVDVKNQLSFYANEKWEDRHNSGEAFAEAFALWSHPKLDRTKFDGPTNKLFDFFDRQFPRSA